MEQLDLFGHPLSKLQRAELLKNTTNWNQKIYKACVIPDCGLKVLNKPWNHFCWQHLIDMYEHNEVLYLKTKKLIPFVIENPLGEP